jgi:hypothetical protein
LKRKSAKRKSPREGKLLIMDGFFVGAKRVYPIKFSGAGARFSIHKQLQRKIDVYGANGFKAYPREAILYGENYNYYILDTMKAKEDVDCPIKGNEVKVPKHIRDALGIKKTGYLVLTQFPELWGPAWELYEKHKERVLNDDDAKAAERNLLKL